MGTEQGTLAVTVKKCNTDGDAPVYFGIHLQCLRGKGSPAARRWLWEDLSVEGAVSPAGALHLLVAPLSLLRSEQGWWLPPRSAQTFQSSLMGFTPSTIINLLTPHGQT